MVKRNVIATKLTKTCTQTQKRAFDVAVRPKQVNAHLENKNEGLSPIVVLMMPSSCLWSFARVYFRLQTITAGRGGFKTKTWVS